MQATHHTIAHLQFPADLAQTKNCKRAIFLPNSSLSNYWQHIYFAAVI